jgi:hypothetical protein
MVRQKKYILDNGWDIEKSDEGTVILHVIPISNSIFRNEQYVEIPEVIFNEVEAGERSTKKLFQKHHLHTFIIQWKESEVPAVSKENSDTLYHGVDFIAEKEGNKYFLDYQLAIQGGGSRKIEISKEIYEDAREGKMSTSDLFKKYNLYHLDIPENDVK